MEKTIKDLKWQAMIYFEKKNKLFTFSHKISKKFTEFLLKKKTKNKHVFINFKREIKK